MPDVSVTTTAVPQMPPPSHESGLLSVRRSFELDANVCALWPIISDTDRMNRLSGMKRIQLEPINGSSAARYRVRANLDGFPVTYEEAPPEYVENERYRVRRHLLGGPLRTLEMGFALSPLPDGRTRVDYELRMEPRLRLIAPVARFNGERRLKSFERELRRLDAALAKNQPAGPQDRRHAVDPERLRRAARSLTEALSPSLKRHGEALVSLLSEGSDFELSRMRPYVIAEQWGADRQDVLTVFLTAVVTGMLELSWELICPSCRTGARRTPTLSEVPASGHCQLCDIGFDIELDRAVEAVFRPAPSIRQVDEGPYCVAGAARTPHVVAQAVIAPGSEAALPVPAEGGRLRVFARGGATLRVDTAAEAAPELRLPLSRLDGASDVTLRPGGRLVIVGDGADERHVKLERLVWADHAATAHHVSQNAAFRRLFAKETLKPGLSLKVSRVTLLFSDLTASTALYSRAGDAYAFRLVLEHFDVLRRVIESHGGVIVKTMGDAIMASFLHDAEAVRAAVGMQQAFVEFRKLHSQSVDVYLKLGLFSGPCYAVTANDALDYFGTTVNVAARLQAKAESGEIVVPVSLAEEAAASGWLGSARISDTFDALLKGIDGPMACARLAVSESPPPGPSV